MEYVNINDKAKISVIDPTAYDPDENVFVSMTTDKKQAIMFTSYNLEESKDHDHRGVAIFRLVRECDAKQNENDMLIYLWDGTTEEFSERFSAYSWSKQLDKVEKFDKTGIMLRLFHRDSDGHWKPWGDHGIFGSQENWLEIRIKKVQQERN